MTTTPDSTPRGWTADEVTAAIRKFALDVQLLTPPTRSGDGWRVDVALDDPTAAAWLINRTGPLSDVLEPDWIGAQPVEGYPRAVRLYLGNRVEPLD